MVVQSSTGEPADAGGPTGPGSRPVEAVATVAGVVVAVVGVVVAGSSGSFVGSPATSPVAHPDTQTKTTAPARSRPTSWPRRQRSSLVGKNDIRRLIDSQISGDEDCAAADNSLDTGGHGTARYRGYGTAVHLQVENGSFDRHITETKEPAVHRRLMFEESKSLPLPGMGRPRVLDDCASVLNHSVGPPAN